MKILKIFLAFLLVSQPCFASLAVKGVTVRNLKAISADNWFRKNIVVAGSADGQQTNYPVRIVLNLGAGTDTTSNIYLAGKSDSNFDGIRFADSDGTTPLKFWREYLDPGNKAVFWVKIPTIPVSPGTASIYVYYGNGAKKYSGNGDDVFTTFVDANDADSFAGNKRWITVSQPYRLDPAINFDLARGTTVQAYGNLSAVKSTTGRYCINYLKFDGTTYNDNSFMEGLYSDDDGKTWASSGTVYTEVPTYQGEPGGLIAKDDGTVVSITKVIDVSTDRRSVSVRHGVSSNNCVSWPASGTWTLDFGPTDWIYGLPNDWQRIGNDWYSIGEIKNYDTSSRKSSLFKFDGSVITKVSDLTNTPYNISEGAVASLGGNNLLAISRHVNDFNGDDSTVTIKTTSSDLGQSWSAQTDIANLVGIIQDPDLTWISGTPGNGVLMLHGRQGPNNDNSLGMGLNTQNNVAWFSYDNGATWKNKTTLFANTQTAGETTIGGYTSAIVDDEFVQMFGWTDSFTSLAQTVATKRLYKGQLENYLELTCAVQNVDTLAEIPFSNSGLTQYAIQSRSKSFNTPETNTSSFIFYDTSTANKVLQYYVPRFTEADVGYLNGGSSTALYNSFEFSTYYTFETKINQASAGTELSSVAVFNADKSSSLGSATNRPYSLGTPSQITTLAVGTDLTSARAFSNIDYVFLRKLTTNEPAINSIGAESATAVYPI